MAKPKKHEDDDPLGLIRWAQERKKLKDNSPIVRTRWWVVDYFPPRRYSNEYDSGWTKAFKQKASDYFDSLEDAQAFVDSHDPEPGAELQIESENLRRITREEWVNW